MFYSMKFRLCGVLKFSLVVLFLGFCVGNGVFGVIRLKFVVNLWVLR